MRFNNGKINLKFFVKNVCKKLRVHVPATH